MNDLPCQQHMRYSVYRAAPCPEERGEVCEDCSRKRFENLGCLVFVLVIAIGLLSLCEAL